MTSSSGIRQWAGLITEPRLSVTLFPPDVSAVAVAIVSRCDSKRTRTPLNTQCCCFKRRQKKREKEPSVLCFTTPVAVCGYISALSALNISLLCPLKILKSFHNFSLSLFSILHKFSPRLFDSRVLFSMILCCFPREPDPSLLSKIVISVLQSCRVQLGPYNSALLSSSHTPAPSHRHAHTHTQRCTHGALWLWVWSRTQLCGQQPLGLAQFTALLSCQHIHTNTQSTNVSKLAPDQENPKGAARCKAFL